MTMPEQLPAYSKGEEKEGYLYSAIHTMHSLKALRRGSHSFTVPGNYTMPAFPL